MEGKYDGQGQHDMLCWRYLGFVRATRLGLGRAVCDRGDDDGAGDDHRMGDAVLCVRGRCASDEAALIMCRILLSVHSCIFLRCSIEIRFH